MSLDQQELPSNDGTNVKDLPPESVISDMLKEGF